MRKLRCHISISLDGFVAGPNQSEENPLGEGGERLHDWVVPLAAWRQSHGRQGGEVNESTRVFEESLENIGASVSSSSPITRVIPWRWKAGPRSTSSRTESSPARASKGGRRRQRRQALGRRQHRSAVPGSGTAGRA
jgi:hypothetical protein